MCFTELLVSYISLAVYKHHTVALIARRRSCLQDYHGEAKRNLVVAGSAQPDKSIRLKRRVV